MASAVVDLGTEGVQRHATLAVPLATAHLGAAETTGALDTNTLGAGLAGRLDSLAHGTTEGHTALELLSDGLGNEDGVELGRLISMTSTESWPLETPATFSSSPRI
mgnify:CR=1 FL=1